MLWVLAGVAIVAIVAIVTIFIFSHVDDWSRDLTTNTAWTDDAAETLKPLRLSKTPERVRADVLRVVESMANWQVADGDNDANDADDTAMKVHLVRTTTIMRFKDDIWVTFVSDEIDGSTVVQVRSQSRLGRGDLGQNPRNIQELLQRLSQTK